MLSCVLVVATLMTACTVAVAAPAPVAKLRDLGVPVKGVNWVKLIPGLDASGRECLYATMGQTAQNFFVLQINPQTGEFKQYVSPVPGSNFPVAAVWGPDDCLYACAAWTGHLLRFDPQKDKLEDLGPVNEAGGAFPCRMDFAPDGSLFIGWYGEAGLTRYDPKAGKFTYYGRCDDVDQYNYPLVNRDGIVACQIRASRMHVVLLDPRSGERKPVGPTANAGEPGKRVELFRGTDGDLYISSHEGYFRIEGMRIEPVTQVPNSAPLPRWPENPTPHLADGSTFGFADARYQEYRELVIEGGAAGSERRFHLDYAASGSSIFLLHQGPDGCVYGSTYMPLHLFRYDPRDGAVTDFGVCTEAAGEAYSMANLGSTMYIASYPGARLSVYDVARPYHYGLGPADNPRDVGTVDGDISYRPRAMLTGPRGRVWLGSYPNYGCWGGPLTWYDPRTGDKGSYGVVLKDQSVTGLVWLEKQGLILGCTSIEGGSGTSPRARQAALFLWDPVGEKRVWSRIPHRGAHSITSLVAAPDGLVYGFGWGREPQGRDFAEVFAFSPETREFVGAVPVAEPVYDHSIRIGVDCKVYLVTANSVFRIAPGAAAAEQICRLPEKITVPGPLMGKTLYVGIEHRLCALDLP
jgi:hypothetical protein